jgi:hypothetical protein
VLVGIEQAVEVEASRPLVFSLQNRLGVVQADLRTYPARAWSAIAKFSVAALSRRYAPLISSISASLFVDVSSPRLRDSSRRSYNPSLETRMVALPRRGTCIDSCHHHKLSIRYIVP